MAPSSVWSSKALAHRQAACGAIEGVAPIKMAPIVAQRGTRDWGMALFRRPAISTTAGTMNRLLARKPRAN